MILHKTKKTEFETKLFAENFLIFDVAGGPGESRVEAQGAPIDRAAQVPPERERALQDLSAQQREEREALRRDVEALDNARNTVNNSSLDRALFPSATDFETVEKQTRTSIDPLLFAGNQFKEGVSTDWEYNSLDGLAKTHLNLKKLGIDVSSPFYKSCFGVMREMIKHKSDGTFNNSPYQTYLDDPVKNKDALSGLDIPYPGFGKYFKSSVDHLISLQRIAIKNQQNRKLESDPDAVDKALGSVSGGLDDVGEKASQIFGTIGEDIGDAWNKKNWGKLFAYGLGGVAAYWGGKNLVLPGLKGAWGMAGKHKVIMGVGVGALALLFGGKKGLELAQRKIDEWGLADLFGDSFKEWGLMKEDSPEEKARRLRELPSIDAFTETLRTMGSERAQTLEKGDYSEKVLRDLKYVEISKLIGLKEANDRLGSPANFIAPNHPLFIKIFPEFAHSTLEARAYSMNELEDLRKKDPRFVQKGREIYDTLAALEETFSIFKQHPNYANKNFADLWKSEPYKSFTVMDYCDAIRDKFDMALMRQSENVEALNTTFTTLFANSGISFEITENPRVDRYVGTLMDFPVVFVFDPATDAYYVFARRDLPDDKDADFTKAIHHIPLNADSAYLRNFKEVTMRDYIWEKTDLSKKMKSLGEYNNQKFRFNDTGKKWIVGYKKNGVEHLAVVSFNRVGGVNLSEEDVDLIAAGESAMTKSRQEQIIIDEKKVEYDNASDPFEKHYRKRIWELRKAFQSQFSVANESPLFGDLREKYSLDPSVDLIFDAYFEGIKNDANLNLVAKKRALDDPSKGLATLLWQEICNKNAEMTTASPKEDIWKIPRLKEKIEKIRDGSLNEKLQEVPSIVSGATPAFDMATIQRLLRGDLFAADPNSVLYFKKHVDVYTSLYRISLNNLLLVESQIAFAKVVRNFNPSRYTSVWSGIESRAKSGLASLKANTENQELILATYLLKLERIEAASN